MNYSSFRFIKVQVIERVVLWLMPRYGARPVALNHAERAEALAGLPEIDGLPEIKFDLSFLEAPDIEFDLSFLNRHELVDDERRAVGELDAGYSREWQQRDLDEGFLKRSVDVRSRSRSTLMRA